MKYKIRKALEYYSIKNIFSQTEKNNFLNEIPTSLKYEVIKF